MSERIFTCKECGVQFTSKNPNAKYCSHACLWKNNGKWQQRHEIWWVNQRGYIEGHCLVNGVWKRKKYHRHVVEQSIGRELRPDEDVHHINGDKTDNRIENLMLISHREHSILSNANRAYKTGYKMSLPQSERLRRSKWMTIVHRVKKLNNGAYSREIAEELLAREEVGE